MGGEQASEVGFGNLTARIHLAMGLRQRAGVFRRVRLAQAVQKSRNVGQLLRTQLGELRLDLLHAHD